MAADKPKVFYGYFVVCASFLIMVGLWSAYYSFGVFFKPILNEFGWTRAMTSGAFSLATFIGGLLAIAMGILTDRFGPRLVMSLCGIFLGLGYFLMSRINALWQLYLFYGIIVGIGMGGSFVPIMSTVARWFFARRNLMTGLIAAGIGIGGFVGPQIARWLISTNGWRSSYVIVSVIVITFVVLSAQILRKNPAQVGQKPFYGKSAQAGSPPSQDEGLLLSSALHTRQFWLIALNFFCFGFCIFSIMVHIAPHAADLGVSAAGAAKILAGVGGFGIVGKLFFGRMGDIFGSKKVLIISSILLAGSLAFLAGVSAVWGLYLFVCLFGVAFGGCGVSHPPLVAWLFGLGSLGLVLGVLNLGFTIGGALGPFFTGYIFDIAGSYLAAFVVCAIFSLIGLFAIAILKPVEK
ncbi:MFS transporter [Thermodesulfobacteriota bacterium]